MQLVTNVAVTNSDASRASATHVSVSHKAIPMKPHFAVPFVSPYASYLQY